MTSIPILLRASVLIGVVWVVHVAFAPRMSSAMRHFLRTLVVLALLLLPVLSFVLPAWTVVGLPASSVLDVTSGVPSSPVSSR